MNIHKYYFLFLAALNGMTLTSVYGMNTLPSEVRDIIFTQACPSNTLAHQLKLFLQLRLINHEYATRIMGQLVPFVKECIKNNPDAVKKEFIKSIRESKCEDNGSMQKAKKRCAILNLAKLLIEGGIFQIEDQTFVYESTSVYNPVSSMRLRPVVHTNYTTPLIEAIRALNIPLIKLLVLHCNGNESTPASKSAVQTSALKFAMEMLKDTKRTINSLRRDILVDIPLQQKLEISYEIIELLITHKVNPCLQVPDVNETYKEWAIRFGDCRLNALLGVYEINEDSVLEKD